MAGSGSSSFSRTTGRRATTPKASRSLQQSWAEKAMGLVMKAPSATTGRRRMSAPAKRPGTRLSMSPIRRRTGAWSWNDAVSLPDSRRAKPRLHLPPMPLNRLLHLGRQPLLQPRQWKPLQQKRAWQLRKRVLLPPRPCELRSMSHRHRRRRRLHTQLSLLSQRARRRRPLRRRRALPLQLKRHLSLLSSSASWRYSR